MLVTDDITRRTQDFWKVFESRSGGKSILIEEPTVPIIVHKLAICSVILNQARGYVPVWLQSGKWPYPLSFLQAYCSLASYVRMPASTAWEKCAIVLVGAWKFCVLLCTGNLLAFTYDGVRYGDIVYDTYLADTFASTIRGFNFRMLKIMCACIRRHRMVRKTLQSGNYGAVLVSHRVGIQSGVMLRCAIRYGYEGYLHIGYHQPTLQRFAKLSDVYIFENAASDEEIDEIIRIFGHDLEKAYAKVYESYVSGKGSVEANYAFSASNRRFSDRKTFAEAFHLDPQKPNVFILLHAFNDYPHSHFRGMLFNDYYDWMMKTLEFAKTCRNVQWVFKQHPTIKMYPTLDVSFEEIFGNLPSHIVYIDEHHQIDTRSLVNCADAVITCLGSIGFELPAMAGIPSIIASDTFYAGLGFTKEPQTRAEYFHLLSNLPALKHLTHEQQQRARAAYMHVYQFSSRLYSGSPRLSYEIQKNTELQLKEYWGIIEKLYEDKREQILADTRAFIQDASQPNFRRTSSLKEFEAQFFA